VLKVAKMADGAIVTTLYLINPPNVREI
jgi:hypothetical protein